MQDNKKWYQSRTVLSGIVAVLSGVAGLFGFAFTPEEQEIVISAVSAIGGALGGLGAVYYRIKAKKAVS